MTMIELEQIAHKLIADKIAEGEQVQMEWAVHEIIKGRGKIDGKGVPFYTLCAREQVYRVVKKAVDKYEIASDNTDRTQISLAGFDYLQAAYTVEREDVRILVPIHLISDEELEARACEFDKLALGIREHAREIRKYIAARRKQRAA